MNKSIFIIFLVLLIFSNCSKKNNEKVVTDQNQQEEKKLSIEYFKNIVNNAKELNPEVCIAIQALYKEFILKTVSEIGDITNPGNMKIFEERKKEFFKDLFVTEEEFNSYFQKNIEQINQYAMEHPEVIPFLSLDN